MRFDCSMCYRVLTSADNTGFAVLLAIVVNVSVIGDSKVDEHSAIY